MFIFLLSVFLASQFREVPNTAEETPENLKTYLKGLKYSFRYILKSDRLKSLILFCGIFCGYLSSLNSLRRSLLQDIGLEAKYVGIAFAFFGLFAAVSASKANWFNKVFHNKYLKFSAITLSAATILSGLVALIPMPGFITTFFILVMFSIQHIVKGSFFTLNKRYLSSFSTSSLRTKIFSVNNMFEAICAASLSFICSLLLRHMSTAYTAIILSLALSLILLKVLSYMKTRVGLKPEEYKKNDIPVEIK